MQRFMPVKSVTIFDLEYTDPELCNARKIPIQIWDIGAVKVDAECNILDTFSEVCKVDENFLTPHCRYVCKIQKGSLTNAPEFPIIYQKFREFVGNDNLMGFGSEDKHVLQAQAGKWDFIYPYFDGLSFVAGILADYEGKIKSYSLKSLCRHFEIDLEPNHRALVDSVCLSKLIHHLLS
jgi:DNA polymerase III epsilon subunit-like protein